jgi:pyruvate/2-oxoglutarate/acetoin dehydrogenase E1 component
VSNELTYSGAFAEGVAEEMSRNPDIFVLGTDLVNRGGHWAQVKGLAEHVGTKRVIDSPISEAAMVATGVGAALAGMHPIIDLNFVDFSFGAMDEIANQAAKIGYMLGHPVPLVIRATAGVAHGGPQHNNSLEAWFMHMPGLVVVVPSTPWDVKGLIKTALRSDDPVMFLMHKRLTGLHGPVGGDDELVPFGSAAIRTEGTDCTIVSYAGGMAKSLAAAEILERDGVSCEVIDLRTLSPMDIETVVTSAKKTGHVVVVDEAPKFAGPGAEVAAAVQEAAFAYLDAPAIRVGALRTTVPESPPLFDRVLPTTDMIVSAVRRSFTIFDDAAAVSS